MSVKTVTPGEVLYIVPKDLTVLVVMANEKGFRYIDPMNPQFDDMGNVLTVYISYESMSQWTVSFGSITNISATLMGKKSK